MSGSALRALRQESGFRVPSSIELGEFGVLK